MQELIGIAAYPLDTQFEYNNKLLNLDKKAPKLSVDSIKDLTEKQAKELLLKLLAAR